MYKFQPAYICMEAAIVTPLKCGIWIFTRPRCGRFPTPITAVSRTNFFYVYPHRKGSGLRDCNNYVVMYYDIVHVQCTYMYIIFVHLRLWCVMCCTWITPGSRIYPALVSLVPWLQSSFRPVPAASLVCQPPWSESSELHIRNNIIK